MGEVGTVITGSTPSTKDSENYSSNDFCFIKPGDLPSDGIGRLSSSENYLSKKGYSLSRHLSKGSVLVSCIGSIGKIGVLEVEATINQQINAIIPNSNITPLFLSYSILSIREIMINKANAPVVPIINKTDFSNFVIPIPPMEEQEKIVAELDLLQSVIDKKKAQLDEYDKLAQSIFYEMFGDPIDNPKKWEVKKLGEVCEYAKTRICSNDISINNYVGVDNLLQKCKGKTVATKVPKDLGLTKYVEGDVLVGNIRPYLKKIWLADCCGGCNGDVLAIRRKTLYEKDIETAFLFKYLSTDNFFEFTMQYAKGEKMPRGDKKEIMKYPIPLPPLSLQQSFAEKIEAIEHQKELVKQSLNEVKTLFDSRIDYYFN